MKKKHLITSLMVISGLSLVFFIAHSSTIKKPSCRHTPNTIYSDARANHLLDLLCASQKKYDLKAVMFGAWIDGKEVLVTAMGDSMTNVPAAADMNFRTGGATFTFLTTLLLQLVDSGKITLNDKLSNWFPQLPHADLITLDMLGRSTSGYADYVTTKGFDESFMQNVFKEWTPEELIGIGVKQPLLYQPGKGWNYSHTNYVILAAALEKITGKALPELLQENIFDKLKLKDTACPLTPDIQPPVLHTYTAERGIYEDSTYWNPSWVGHSARITSNLSDLGKWLQAFGTGQLISPQSFQAMIAPVTVRLGLNKPDLYYGLGVMIGNSWIMQNPAFAGFTGMIAYLPSKKISVYITTTNNDKKDRENVHYSKLILKDAVKILAPDNPLPDRL